MGALAQNRQRRIHAHRCNGFPSALRHGQYTLLQIVIGVAECLLHPLSFLIGKFRYTPVWYLQISKRNQLAVKPFSIRLPFGIIFLQLFVINHTSLYRVHQQKFARAQPFF